MFNWYKNFRDIELSIQYQREKDENEKKEMIDTNAAPDLEKNMPSNTDPIQTARRAKIYQERPLDSACRNIKLNVLETRQWPTG